MKKLSCAALSTTGIFSLLASCARSDPKTKQKKDDEAQSGNARPVEPRSHEFATENGGWAPQLENVGSLPQGKGQVKIDGFGSFSFEEEQVETLRPDIFQNGHFSLFDALVHLHQQGSIDLEYHWDDDLNTHTIDRLNGQEGWWYQAHYANGWPEHNAYRMDLYPYKTKTNLRIVRDADRQSSVYRTFREEMARLTRNAGQVIIPDVQINSPVGNWSFQDVHTAAHNVRADLLKPGVITALDTLISLTKDRALSDLHLTWYEAIGAADPVDSYWVSQINDAVASGGCGFVYEAGDKAFSGFRGAHIHLPADARVIVSPAYMLWFWICL